MKLLQNILTTIDFSKASEKVIDKSILLAKKFSSNITLLFVIPDRTLSDKTKQIVYESVHNKLCEIADKIKADGVSVKEIIIKEGIPFEEIINESHRKEYNVIIAGGGEKQEEDTYKLGTTVVKLMRKNQVPLWVVKNKSIKKIKKIVCPVDFSDASKRALDNAITISTKFNAQLDIITVFTPTYINSPWYKVDKEEENANMRSSHESGFTEFLKNFNLYETNHKTELLVGEPYIQILKYIKSNKVDLLCMGTTGKTGLSRLLMGSVTEKVTREFPCSFITTKAMDLTKSYFESNLTSIESIIKTAKALFDNHKYELALEKYMIGLKQHPENIPLIKGLIETNKALGNNKKVEHYKSYAKDVITRIWGEEYIDKFDFLKGM